MPQSLAFVALVGVITYYALEIAEKAWTYSRAIRNRYPNRNWRRRSLIVAVAALSTFFLSSILVHVGASVHVSTAVA